MKAIKPILNYKESYNMHVINSSRFAGSTFDQQGKYTEAELNIMITVNGFIPVATPIEFNAIRHNITQEMGIGSPWVGNYVTGLNKKYVQINNLDFSSYGTFTPLPSFSGIYDGNKTNISNLNLGEIGSSSAIFGSISVIGRLLNISTINTTSIPTAGATIAAILIGSNNGLVEDCDVHGSIIGKVGVGANLACFVGMNNASGVIRRCSAMGIVSGASDVGGFSGYSTGTFENCNADVDVTGTSAYVGGFISRALNGCIINKCSATGEVTQTGSIYAGGFSGYSDGAISDCYSTGNIIAISNMGGFVGQVGSGSITNCYSIGAVPLIGARGGFTYYSGVTIINCYYDSDTSGQSDIGKGVPKSTIEMQQGLIPDTAIYVGWSASIWDAGTTSEYPTLL